MKGTWTPVVALACSREAEVLAAARIGALAGGGADTRGASDLAAHARECRACTAALAAESWLAALAATVAAEARLPEPGLLLLRAREERLAAASRRALRPLRAAHVAAIAAGAGTLAALVPFYRHAMPSWADPFGRLLAPSTVEILRAPAVALPAAVDPGSLLLLGTLLLSGLVAAMILAWDAA